ALKAGVIDLVVADFSKLLEKLEGKKFLFHGKETSLALKDAKINEIEPRLIDYLLSHIGHPQIAYMLMSLGSMGVYIEIINPGLIFPGVFGAISVILGLISLQALPVNMGFLLLLILGIALMISEYFVAGFGVLGIGGAVAFILGSLNLFDDPSAFEYQDTIRSVSIAVGTAMLLITFVVARGLLFGARKRKLDGAIGEAMVSFDRKGYVLVDEERWHADTTETLNRGDQIEVLKKKPDGRLLVWKRKEVVKEEA
ncbi:MAG: nodulation protein NfeD, partial [Candidatus Neomarinimicrobiota bacterium]